MPVNPQDLHESIGRLRTHLASSASAINGARAEALRLMQDASTRSEPLITAISAAAAADPTLRCAIPIQARITESLPAPATGSLHTILAADGSQIFADRHEEITFALINVAAVCVRQGTGAAPDVTVDTRLLFGDDLYSRHGDRLSEGDLALQRDAAERRALLESAPQGTSPVVLIDGPLELWGAKDVSDPGAFEHALQGYLADMREMRRHDFVLAGYVDKPGADLVLRMLELLPPGSASPRAPGSPRPLRMASDRWLFGQLLPPGHRSVIFGLQSSSRQRYTDDLSLHFFYLNAGRVAHPVIARVEIPQWVSADLNLVSSLHGILLGQCQLLGDRPYPYILHRAHESARVTTGEKEQIKLRLLLQLRSEGIEPESISSKSSAKALGGIRGRS